VGPKSFQWEGVIKIWTRGQNLAQKSKFSELPQNERVRSPHRHEPNATHLGSNRRRMREISRSVRIVKQAKKNVLTVQSVQMLTWHVRTMMWQRHTNVAQG
jgi:hypothetical protein